MREHSLGLIFSTSGPYAALGLSALAGARVALDEVNAAGALRLRAEHADPRGAPEEYGRMTAAMLGSGRIRHVVGGITSWSRKDMIPVLERHGALLWYPCPYEGFEQSDHVAYLGACPNQHLLPLIDHMAADAAQRAYLIGSNYVWGWETLRVARDRLGERGAEVLGERYLPLGDTNCALAVEDLQRLRPDIVVNSLIGPSNHAFMAALAAIRNEHAGLAPGRCRVVSANQTEADLADLGAAADGLLSIGAWFEDVTSDENVRFLERVRRVPGAAGRLSCFFVTAYVAVHLIADGLARSGHDDPAGVFQAVAGRSHATPLGPISLDPVTRHARLVPRLAVAEAGRFRILRDDGQPVDPDPYLARVTRPEQIVGKDRPILRVVL
jgi:ABC-type branched-subunit amino acid transport system substrate-binding protein